MQVLYKYKVNPKLLVMTYRSLNIQLQIPMNVISPSDKYSGKNALLVDIQHQFISKGG